VTPIAVRRDAPTDLVGRTLTAIGFGTTPAREVGIKYRTTTTLESVTGVVLTARNAICQGDSGGPLILESDGVRPREIVGVASFGQVMAEGDCPAILDAWNRVDIQLELIDRAIIRSGGCVASGAEACNSLDDDCNSIVDDGCAALGEACTADTDCAYAALPPSLAEGAPRSVVCAGGACSLPCDAMDPLGTCTSLAVPFRATLPLEGFYCASAGGCDGLCRRGTAGAGGNAAPCTADTDCASLRCEPGVGVCSTPCSGGATSCPSDEVCAADVGACGFCAGAASRPVGRANGEPCGSDGECASGTCRDVEGARICSPPCGFDSDCGPGMHCVFADDGTGACARGPRSALWDPCATDADCAGTECVTATMGRLCATRCGMGCTGACETIGAGMYCVPTDPVLGQACTGACAQGECVGGVCEARCGGREACPIGWDCAREGARTVCRPRRSGGCSVGSGSGAHSIMAIVLAMATAAWRRRDCRARARGTSTCTITGPAARSAAR
jgi:hypothetical protein